MYLLYNLVLFISGLVLVPYYLLRGFRYGKSRRGIRERLGYYTDEQLQRLQQHQVLWIHAVSVGETRAAMPLISALRQRYPQHLILVTNVTETGHAVAQENSQVDMCLFFPFDFSWVVRKSLAQIRPQIILIVETEIWPNFVRQANALAIPLMLVNGRLSDRSFPRYRMMRVLLRPILQCFNLFCMQSQVDAERIIALGAASEQVENCGNLKFDHQILELSEIDISELKTRYRIPAESLVLVAGSTHDGEERQLLEAFLAVGATIQQPLVLVLVPRHPERRRDIQSLLKEMGISGRLRSELNSEDLLLTAGEVLIGDTLGEVLPLYCIADLVFVGGSLVPVGGHNLLEAALASKPVVFGPHVHNFKEISAKLIHAGAGIKVEDKGQLVQVLVTMLGDPARCRAMGEAGRALIAENVGATQRTVRHLERIINQ
ncbi:MAG: 3-deoxy-D-manno-octulosonic acid transferase [Desulfuromonadales bacterium]|nr:3-deoxy-D-manno-octulosonic acid transferase [Desulfuromonadales bacterium]